MSLAACEHLSRSAVLKLSHYDFEALLGLDLEALLGGLDPAAMRLAVELETGSELDLERTGLFFERPSPKGAGVIFLSVRVEPARDETEAFAGLPLARPARRWHLYAMRDQDRRTLEELRALVRSRGSTSFEILDGESLQRLFPALPKSEGTPAPFDFEIHGRLDLRTPPDAPRARYPLRVWLLLEPRDGYFELIDSVVDLDARP